MTSIFIRISSDWGVKLKLFKVLGIIFFIAPDTFQNDGFVSESRRGKKNDFNEWQYFYFLSVSFDELAQKSGEFATNIKLILLNPIFIFLYLVDILDTMIQVGMVAIGTEWIR